MDRVAMGSPLSPVIANFIMEDFEKKAIEQATHKPVCWFRYVDDTLIIWPHGQEKLTEFLNHPSGHHNKIQFTREKDGHLPFLDIDIYKKMDGSLGHKVYRKPTHTNLYLHQNLHHHPAKKQSVLASLVHRAKAVYHQDSLTQDFLPPSSRTVDTALNRYDEPWNQQHGLPRPMINAPRLHTYHTPKQHMADLADRWPNTTSEVSLYHLEKYSATFHQSMMH